jgi:tetratricopeptide (TPR) repeat protein
LTQLVLFLSATPNDQEELKFVEAYKDIKAKVEGATYNEQFDCRQDNKVSIEEMQTYLWKLKPQIVHFFGHGEKGYLMLQDANGEVEEAQIKPFAEMFGILNNRGGISKEQRIRCVVLCACSSGKIAEAVSKYVEFAIGTIAPISEESARIFAKIFYFHLCSGDSLQDAFDMANSQVSFKNQKENKIFKIYCSSVDSKNVYFINPNEKTSITQTTQQEKQDEEPKIAAQVIEQIDSFYEDAANSLKIGNYQQAISHFELCLRSKPSNDKAWVGKGDCYRKMGEKARQSWGGNAEQNYESALACYNNALRYNSKSVEAWIGKADCLEYLESQRDTDIFADIKDCYDKITSMNPQLFEAYSSKGYLYLREYNSGRQSNKETLVEAARIFDQALKINPNSIESWYGKGEALELQFSHTQNQNVIREAIECLDNALRIDPSYSEAREMRDALADSLQKLNQQSQGTYGKPQQPSYPPQQQPPAYQDYLSGRWFFPNGAFWDFTKQGYDYLVMEFTAFGKVAEGRAAINGNNVFLSMNGYNGVHYEANLILNNNVLQGNANIMGMIQPIIAYRGM